LYQCSWFSLEKSYLTKRCLQNIRKEIKQRFWWREFVGDYQYYLVSEPINWEILQ
jgi:hypothetical protein